MKAGDRIRHTYYTGTRAMPRDGMFIREFPETIMRFLRGVISTSA